MINDVNEFLDPIRQLHAQIRDAVVTTCEQKSSEAMSAIVREGAGDTIYEIDRVSEELLVEFFTEQIAVHTPLVLIAEGLENDGMLVLPEGTDESEARWRVIMDPIDGTRGLMYQKRTGWILTGVAANHGPQTNLSHIELAMQTEIPLVKQHLSDTMWAIRGQGVQAERYNRLTGEAQPMTMQPSKADSIIHGFAMVTRFFPGAREELAAIDEEIIQAALGPVKPGKADCFEDQYISSAGQLYELMVGHDRFNADLRPFMGPVLAKRGLNLGACCHPYDLCTELIAREVGVIVTDGHGQPLNPTLDVTTDVSWVGYANQTIHDQIEPLLQEALRRRNLIE